MLLDEADVFLEQRSLANLERNALVSGLWKSRSQILRAFTELAVFLRVLEYYDGEHC